MSNLETMHQKAATLYEEKKLDEALSIYKEIIKLNPIDEVALSCVMDIYLEKDDKFNYYLSRANVNIASNKIEYAISDTKKALDLDIENIEARRKLARLYKVSNKNLKAIDEFIKLLEISEKELDAYFELAELYMKENSIDSAISIVKKGTELLEVVEDDFLRVKILLQDEKNSEAFEFLSKIDFNKLQINEKLSYHILMAQYYYNSKEFDKSLVQIDNYTKLARPDAISFQMKALIYEELKDDFNSHLNWGFCYKLQNKFDDAIVEFDHAYKINGKDKTVLIELANLYQHNKEKFVAMEYWQRVYDIDKDERAREILAEFYYSEGNFEKAKEYGKEVEQKEEHYEGLIDKIMNFFSKK